jgi:prepilin-type N-terminal cleavage/methylation domain-containing protein
MTSPTSAPSCHSRRGFTLIELLVTIGILVILSAIAIPMVSRAWRSGMKTRIAGDLQAIATALEAYKTDFGDYPRLRYSGSGAGTIAGEADTGSKLLCWALIAPGPATDPGSGEQSAFDGVEGPGFRARPGGKIHGPYLDAAKFKVTRTDADAEMLDSNGSVIVYVPGFPGSVNITTGTGGYIADDRRALYDARATQIFQHPVSPGASAFRRVGEGNDADALQRFRNLMGDIDNDGLIGAGETAAHRGPYLLWSAGYDGLFGTASHTPTPAERAACDDVTNFNR